MNEQRVFLITAILLGAFIHQAATAQPPGRTAVLVDTDFGADVDDVFALALALGSEELELRGITTVGDDAHQKAMMVCRFLTVTGRRHMAVAAGEKPQPKRPVTNQFTYFQHPDVAFDRTKKPEKQAAAEFLHGRLPQSPKATLVALGPLTNIARLIETHPDAASRIERVIVLEKNIKFDVPAAQKVFGSGAALVVLGDDACKLLRLDDVQTRKVFDPGTALTRQVETIYQMWDGQRPPLAEALAVAHSFAERFAKTERRALAVDDEGALQPARGEPNATVVTSVQADEFLDWYVQRISSLLPPRRAPVKLIEHPLMPHRVHVAEDFENDIERFWWVSGKPETQLLPPGSRRACRGVLTHDFDDLLMVSREMYTAVIFNPVPGPPMGENARLSFRYWLKGTDTIRVQIYSLSNGYHRHLVVEDLPQQEWRHATVDMTQARRPDGTGGPLSDGERIDDIQFYVDPSAEILIDDIFLYDAASEGEKRPFPQRIMFTGWFDSGGQGREWPGEFKLVDNAGNYRRAAQSVENAATGQPWLRIGLRGQRALGEKSVVSLRYRLSGSDSFQLRLVNTSTGKSLTAGAERLQQDAWAEAAVDFDTKGLSSVDEIHLLLPKGGELLVDDLLLFEP